MHCASGIARASHFGNNSFYRHLESFEITASELDVRVVRELDKLSNYWRISRDLARICSGNRRYKSCRPLFKHLTLDIVPHHNPVSSANTDVRLNRFVHAEVQMAIYHETRRSQSLPRMIGSSKAACYLCDAFIRAHGIFQVSKAHRQVYNQWTVPGSPRLDARTMHRLSAALGQVDEEVREELSLAQGCRRGRLYPFQSSINLHNTVISTRSNSTVSPLPQSREGRQSNICQVKLSTPAATSDDTEKFSSQAPIRSPQRSNTVENAILTVFDRLSSEKRSGSACKSSRSVERLHNLASSISPSPPENYGKVTPKLEMIRSSPPFVGPNSNAATELTADTCIIHGMYSSRGEVHALQGSFRSNFSDQSNSISSHETILKDLPIKGSADDDRNDLASGCAESSWGDISFEVSPSSPRELQVGTFQLHVYLEKSSEDSKPYTHGSIKANYLPSKSIHTEPESEAIMLVPGEERVLLCRDYARDQGPQIIIEDDHGGVVNISCTWHRAIQQRT